MRTKSLLLSAFAIFLSGIFLAGCGSTRIVSTLKPSANPNVAIENIRFNISALKLVSDDEAKTYMEHVTKELLSTRAISLYPEIFSDEWTALPIEVNASAKREYNPTGVMLTALTGGVIPFPASDKIKLNTMPVVRSDVGGSLIKVGTDIEVSQVTWMSLIGPLGCIPVPGHADLPRDGIFLFIPLTKDAYSTTKLPYYIADCMVEAIVKSLLSVDAERLASAYRARSSRLRKVVIDGREAWCFVAPVDSPDGSSVRSFKALFYNERPKIGSTAFDEAVVARLSENGRWEPVTSYLRSASSLIAAASCVIDNGLPGHVTLKSVAQPPLEDFITLPDPATAEDISWSNSMLIEAKNTTLPRLLLSENRTKLIELINKIEKEVLHLNEFAELSDSRAQQIVLKGGDPSGISRIAVLCRQRITIFQSVLAALKKALAN